MTKHDCKTVRGILHHHGRLAAIRWLRAVKDLPYLVAKKAVEDIRPLSPQNIEFAD